MNRIYRTLSWTSILFLILLAGCAGGHDPLSFTKIYNNDPVNPANWICRSKYGSTCIKKLASEKKVSVQSIDLHFEKGSIERKPELITFKKIKGLVTDRVNKHTIVVHPKTYKRIMKTPDKKRIPMFYSFRTDYVGWSIILVNKDEQKSEVRGKLCVRFIKPDGSLWRNKNANKSCSVIKTFSLSSQIKLGGKWGRKNRSVYKEGPHTIEFWLEGTKIANYDFYVIEQFL